MSPQKRVKKIPTICTCQTFIYYVNLLKTNFEVIFKALFRAKKFQNLLWAHRPSKPTIGFLEMPTLIREPLCHLVRIDVRPTSSKIVWRIFKLKVLLLDNMNFSCKYSYKVTKFSQVWMTCWSKVIKCQHCVDFFILRGQS